MGVAEDLTMLEMQRTKASIVDEVLLGRDIHVLKLGVDELDGTRSWSIYSRAYFPVRGKELFRWNNSNGRLISALQLTGRPLTVEEAINLVEEFWTERKAGAWAYGG